MRAAPLSFLNEFYPDYELSNPAKKCRKIAKLYYQILKNALEGDHSEFEIEKATKQQIRGKEKGWMIIPLYLYQQCPVQGYPEVMKWVLEQGGDTDTNMAIVGSIISAVVGFEALMEDETTEKNWNKVLECDTELGDYPRPERFHPKRYLQLVKHF
jgi:hypothetical protein